MHQVEVLAHIAAPSRATDDARYRAQAAAAVVDFDSYSRLEIYGLEGSPRGSGHEDRISNVPTPPASPRILLSPRQSVGTGLERANDRHERDWRLRLQCMKSEKVGFDRGSAQESSGTRTQSLALSQAVQPKTASVLSTAPVPAILKRVHSESLSVESLLSMLPESQERDAVTHQRDLVNLDTGISTSGCLAHAQAETLVSDPLAERMARPHIKRRPAGHMGNPYMQSAPSKPAVSEYWSRDARPILHYKQLSTDASLYEPTDTELSKTRLGPRLSEHRFRSSSTLSTLLEAHYPSLCSVPVPRKECPSRVSPSLRTSPVELDHCFNCADPVARLSIFDLPVAVHAPNPQISHSFHTTHLTHSLRALASRLPITDFFRPVHTSRKIRASERGHWVLDIPMISVADQSLTMGASSPTPTSTNKAQQISWTEPQVTQFLHSLSSFIRSGCAGWGVSIYRAPCCSVQPSPIHTSTANDETTIVLKITCWGEIMAHIYLAMWVLSDKRVRQLRKVSWRDANGEVVVKMR